MAAGAGIGFGAFVITIFTMGAGHGTNVPGFILIPWTMLLMLAGAGISTFLLSACAQFAIYIALIRFRPLLALPIGIVHCVAAVWGMARNGILF
ncbi:hypothetical protein [Mesorhizobium silamurunense]|uniref:hypothetical protein n=1 Tax=Mesorhizobium silamurunense TaxID=499528 RepID=UPI00177B6CD0|nr:hypothetical protein [Mesorhizobium silamurunense]